MRQGYDGDAAGFRTVEIGFDSVPLSLLVIAGVFGRTIYVVVVLKFVPFIYCWERWRTRSVNLGP